MTLSRPRPRCLSFDFAACARTWGIGRTRGTRRAGVVDLVVCRAFGEPNLAQQRPNARDRPAGVRVIGVVALVEHCLAVLRVLFHVRLGRSRERIGSTE